MDRSRVSLWAACTLLVMFFIPRLWTLAAQNQRYVVGLASVSQCFGRPLLLADAYRLWTRTLGNIAPCSVLTDDRAPAEIIALVAWLNGSAAATEKLALIQPSARQEIFIWRNHTQLASLGHYAAAVSTEASKFIAQLAVRSWRSGAFDQAIQLSTAALAIDDPSSAVKILTHRIGVSDKEQYTTYHEIRRIIAQAAPSVKEVYGDWFETAIVFHEWGSALTACKGLRDRSQPQGGGLAAVCLARLSIYQGDVASAYANMQNEMGKLGPTQQDAMLLTWFGIAARQMGEYNEARDAFKAAIEHETDPTAFVNLYWQLGDCQAMLGRRVEANEAYKMALESIGAERFRDELLRLVESTQ